jgi:prepilin-type N-terminal cleavage/methylation domain-containing protein
MNYIHNKKGFTLIEILVVIAIIAILVAFISSNFLGARQRAKDVKIKAEFRQMKNALRLYYNDYNVYPGPSSTATNTFSGCKAGSPPSQDCLSECSGVFASGATCSTDVYMKLLPPPSVYAWYYQQRSSGNDFCMWSTLENVSDSEIAKSHLRCDAICPSSVVPTADYVVCAD